MSTLHHSATTASTLLRGQSLPIEVAAGTRLRVQQGHVRVNAAPQWLGARLVLPVHDLQEGATHVFEDGGWLLVDAVSASTLRWHRPEPRPSILQRAWPLLAIWLQRLRPAAG